ncbi:hypothetical protein [Pseudomonas sp. REB1044]|uniref:hypothetical protein n=1 Tax=Pseudomonas sp. REB1044 TaxID=2675224 RepID=UPI00315C86F7
MASAFIGLNENNAGINFDSRYIAYGLRKSGNLQSIGGWPRLLLKSVNLDPTRPSSYSETSVTDILFGFSVQGAIAPIVFINGSGVSCGSSKVGDTTTFLFLLASASTKFYYFDLMSDNGPINGVKCWNEAGDLTFNSSQIPLNVIASVTAPQPPATDPRLPNQYGAVYQGGSNGWDKPSGLAGYFTSFTSRIFVPVASGDCAACITFSRSMGQGRRERSSPPDPANSPALTNLMATMEGCFGVNGGVTFVACDAAHTTMYGSTSAANSYFDIPAVLPDALVIRSSDYPFPYN